MNLIHLFNVITAYKPTKLSKLIKQKTKATHDSIEQHPFYRKLISGELDDKKYLIFLFNMLPVYEHIENELLIPLGYKDLVRSDKILKDIEAYEAYLNFKVDESYFYNLPWLKQLEGKSLFSLKAHFYVRWLADMYGGQVLKKKVRFGEKYKFKNVKNNIKRAREFIDQSITEQNVDSFIHEANKAFEFSRKLVASIERHVK
jgi:heme oxygenase